jgi:hypothetical protein
MLVAKVHIPEGMLTLDQRREIVKGIHDVINSVEKRPPGGQTYENLKSARVWSQHA